MKAPGIALGAALLWIYTLVVVAAVCGVFGSADRLLTDLRYDTRAQPVTGDRVFVAIDSPSLAAVGVWPWPRAVHAQIIDALLDAGAREVVIDVDFSTLSTRGNDAALIGALERAGGYAYLPAFNQAGHDGVVHATLPAEPFRSLADMVAVNVGVDGHGVARTVPLAIRAGDDVIPSLAAMAARPAMGAQEITIDYGIDASTIPTLSASDVLEGRIDAGAMAGRTVVVGASALELQDELRSPNQGMLPGAVIQILAAETAALGRNIQNSGHGPALLALAVLIALGGLFGSRVGLAAIWLSVAATLVLAEYAALAAYQNAAIMVTTAPLHVGALLLGLFWLAIQTRMLQRLIQRLRGERNRVRLALDRVVSDNFDGIVIIGDDWRIASASAFAEDRLAKRLVGKNARAALPRPLFDAVERAFLAGQAPRDSTRVQEVELRRHGETFIAEYVVTVSRPSEDEGADGGGAVACLTFRDVTRRRAHEDRLRYLAEHDEMTGLYTRAHFLRLLDARLQSGGAVHVLVFNLRRFKSVNATLGHEAGDEMLRQVASRLRAAGHDHAARLGADTFAVFMAHDGPDPDPQSPFDPIVDLIAQPYLLGEHMATIGVAGGWASAPASDGAALLRRADLALAQSRQLPGNRVTPYTEKLEIAVHTGRRLETEMRQALESGQFALAYQPQIGAGGNRLVGAEALLRWHHPERGMISPLDFLPVAEETGLIADIGRYVLDLACRDALTWPGDLRVAVNVSPLQFELSDILADIDSALQRTGLPARRLEIEITESVLLQHRDAAIETLRQLSARGVKIAIDDFGTGFSSLAYLSQLPFDVLKVDKSFVDAMFESTAAMRIVETIVKLGTQLDKTVLAEGVETAEQARVLEQLGCSVFQGYYFARPGSPEAMQEQARRQAAEASAGPMRAAG